MIHPYNSVSASFSLVPLVMEDLVRAHPDPQTPLDVVVGAWSNIEHRPNRKESLAMWKRATKRSASRMLEHAERDEISMTPESIEAILDARSLMASLLFRAPEGTLLANLNDAIYARHILIVMASCCALEATTSRMTMPWFGSMILGMGQTFDKSRFLECIANTAADQPDEVPFNMIARLADGDHIPLSVIGLERAETLKEAMGMLLDAAAAEGIPPLDVQDIERAMRTTGWKAQTYTHVTGIGSSALTQSLPVPFICLAHEDTKAEPWYIDPSFDLTLNSLLKLWDGGRMIAMTDAPIFDDPTSSVRFIASLNASTKMNSMLMVDPFIRALMPLFVWFRKPLWDKLREERREVENVV